MERIENIIETYHLTLFPESGGSGIGVYISYITQYSYLLAAILMIILVGTKVATYFANPTKEIDPYILVKPILVLMALSLYQPLVNLLLFYPSDIITDITEDAGIHITGLPNKDEFNSAFYSAITNVPENSTDEDSTNDFYSIISSIPFLEGIHIVIYFIASCVTAYILIRQLLLQAFYYILGMLVLPFSLIPGNEEILKRWFFNFLSVLLWIPMLRMVQTIMILINMVDLRQGGVTIVEVMFPVVLQIVMIFFILHVPTYANLLVSGAGDTDKTTLGSMVYWGKLNFVSNAAMKPVTAPMKYVSKKIRQRFK